MKNHIKSMTIIITTFSCLVYSCEKKEVVYEYYDREKKEIKSEIEYLNGKVNGYVKLYSEDGKIIEVAEWKNGKRNGLTLTFHNNGNTAGEYTFRNDEIIGEYKIYYENGILKKISHIDENGFYFNTKSYDSKGKLLEMEPVFRINSDTLYLGDTLNIKGTLENIDDSKYFGGTMVIGKHFKGEKGDILVDTLVSVSSTLNYYDAYFIPENRGDYSFIAQLVYRFATDKKYNNQPIDTLVMFSTEGTVFIK